MKIPLPRRVLRPVLTCLACVAMMLGLGSCTASVFEILTFTPGVLTAGDREAPIQFTCKVSAIDNGSHPEVTFRNLDGSPATDVTLDGDPPTYSENGDGTAVINAKVTISPTAAGRTVTAVVVVDTALRHFTIGATADLAIVSASGTPPPSLSTLLATGGSSIFALDRGVPTVVICKGSNFDETSQVFAEDPNTVVSDLSYESSESVIVTITPSTRSRTGRGRFYMTTLAGGTSNFAEIALRAAPGASSGNRPMLAGAFPNAIPGVFSQTVTLSGKDLVGATVVTEPVIGIDSREVVDANTLRVGFVPGPFRGVVKVFAQTAAGTSDPIDLTVEPPETPLPRITSIAEDFLTGGITVGKQLRITGENLAAGGASSITRAYLLPNPFVPPKTLGFGIFPPSDPAAADGSVVVALAVLPLIEGDPLPTGPVDLALARSDGKITNVIEISLQSPPPPTDGSPFVSSISPASVARGTEQPLSRQMTINGIRLTDVTGVEFDNPGITASMISPVTGGRQIFVTFTVAPNAVLTGDAATNFQVTTGHGRSPKASIVVTP